MSKVLDDQNKELAISEEEIAMALEQNTKWQGSPGRMWAQIETKLQPIPWYRQGRSWMPVLVAVMLLVIILTNQNSVPQLPQPLDPDTFQAEMMQPEDTVQLRTMSAFDQTAFGLQSQVAIEIGLADVAAAGTELELDLSLSALQGIAFTMETPVIRLMRTDGNGLVNIAAELSINGWSLQTLYPDKPLSGTVLLTAPDEPGMYRIEVSISGSIDGQPAFFGESKNLQVTENSKEE